MAQSQLYTKKAQVFVKAETTVDTYIAPVAGDVFLADLPDVPITFEGANFSPNYQRADFLQMDETPGPVVGTLKFRVPLKGSGTAGTAPEFATALKACGLKETTVAVTSNSYSPSSVFDGAGGNPAQSYTCGVFENGLQYTLKGCFANLVISGNVSAGEPGWLEFTFQGAPYYNAGAWAGIAAAAMVAPTYQTTIPKAFRAAALAISGYTPIGVNAFNLDLGNRIAVRRDANDASGVMGARITSRRSIGTIDPEMVLVATHDFFGIWAAGTVGAFATGTIGSTAGNRWALSVARVVRRPPELANRDGIRALSVPFAVSSVPTDAEGTNLDLTLAFT